MLITFHSRAAADFSMFEESALALLHMMGHSGTVPGAIIAEDLPQALQRLHQALDQEPPEGQVKGEEEPAVGLPRRAYPLVKMLEASLAEGCAVMWDH